MSVAYFPKDATEQILSCTLCLPSEVLCPFLFFTAIGEKIHYCNYVLFTNL